MLSMLIYKLLGIAVAVLQAYHNNLMATHIELLHILVLYRK